MAQTDNLLLFLLLLILPIIGGASAAACSNTYEVGGPGQKWMINSDPNFFISWAARITFYPGDCLQFNQVLTAPVYQLSEADYQTCYVWNPLNSWFGVYGTKQTVGPFPVQSSYPVSFYFSSPYFCDYGMKFAATVNDPSGAPPSPAGSTNSSSQIPSSSGSSPPTKPGSTAPSSTLTRSAPSSTYLSTGSIAGIVAGVVAALTGGGLAYKFHNNFTCCVIHHDRDAAEGNAGGNGAHHGAGSGVPYGVSIGAGSGVAHPVGNGAGNRAAYGVGNGAGNRAAYGVGNEGNAAVHGFQNGFHNGFGDGVRTGAWV